MKSPDVKIGGNPFRIAGNDFQYRSEGVFRPRSEFTGQPGAENLHQYDWPWTLTDFSGGEGRLVFDPQNPFSPPSYKATSGGIDVRVKGEFKMAPITNVVLDNDGGSSTTRWEGNTLTADSGSPTTDDSNAVLNAVEGVAKTGRTPGAVAVTVVARIIPGITPSDTATFRLRVRNTTDGTDTTSASVSLAYAAPSQSLTVSFTGTAGKTYSYIAELTAYSDTGGSPSPQVEVDYIEETSSSSAAPTDVRHVQLGYGNKPFAYHWDGSNTDIFVWDFTNDMWDTVDPDVDNSLPVASATSDTYNYLLVADRVIFRHTDAAAASTTYTSAPANTTLAGGIAVANNRLYGLFFGGTGRGLYEYDLDGTAVPYAGTAKMTNADIPDEASHDTTLRQIITSTGGGVRFFVNAAGGTSQVYEYSEGAGRPMRLAALGAGYTMTAIHHAGGITWVAVQHASLASAPAKKRAQLWYIGEDGVLKFAGEFRGHNPDDERPCFIQTDQHFVYVLQGKYLWKYDTSTGGIVLDTLVGPTTDSNARSFAVMDLKKWVAYSGEGTHVTRDSYPIDETNYLEGPLWDYDVPADDKILIDFRVVTKPLPAATEISLDYQDNEDGTWTTVTAPASAVLDGATTHTFPVWGTAASPTTVTFRNLQWRVGLRSSDGADTPTVRSVTARAYVMDYEEVFEFAVRLDDQAVLGNQRLSAKQRFALLETIKDNRAIISFENHYEGKWPGIKNTYAAFLTDVVQNLEGEGRGTARVKLRVLS